MKFDKLISTREILLLEHGVEWVTKIIWNKLFQITD